jgi:hypothetical protein
MTDSSRRLIQQPICTISGPRQSCACLLFLNTSLVPLKRAISAGASYEPPAVEPLFMSLAVHLGKPRLNERACCAPLQSLSHWRIKHLSNDHFIHPNIHSCACALFCHAGCLLTLSVKKLHVPRLRPPLSINSVQCIQYSHLYPLPPTPAIPNAMQNNHDDVWLADKFCDVFKLSMAASTESAA